MHGIIVAFKHFRHDNENSDKVISFWTGSDYMHAQLILPDGRCFSAWTSQGVEFRSIEETILFSRLYRYFRLNVIYDLMAIEQFALSQYGKGFDYQAIYLTQGIPLNLEEKNKWFCSEVTYHVLKEFTTTPLPSFRPSQVNPGMLLQMVEKLPSDIAQEIFI